MPRAFLLVLVAVVAGCSQAGSSSDRHPIAKASGATTAAAPAPAPAPAPSASGSTSAPTSPSPPDTPLVAVARLLTPHPGDTWSPARMALTSFREDAGTVEITCEARDFEDIAELMRRLTKTPGFDSITILSAHRLSPETVTGHIRARVTDEGHVVIASRADVIPSFGPDLRNPFEPVAARAAPSDRSVAGNVALGSLKVVGITRGDAPIALLSDPSGLGITVRPGDLVGRIEGGSDDASCRWRVQSVRSDAVVFARNDPARCTAAPETQTLKLRP